MRIYEERQSREMWVEKIWRVFVERRRCEHQQPGAERPENCEELSREHRRCEMWVEKDWVVLKKHRRCDMLVGNCYAYLWGAAKPRNVGRKRL